MRLASVKVYKFSAIKDQNEIQFAHLYFDRCANHYVHPHLLVEVQHCSLDKTQDLCCELTKSTVVFYIVHLPLFPINVFYHHVKICILSSVVYLIYNPYTVGFNR